MDEIIIKDKLNVDPLLKPTQQIIRLFEKERYRPIELRYLKKWAKLKGIGEKSLSRCFKRLPIKRELIGDPRNHRWFLRLLTPTEKLTSTNLKEELLSQKQRGCELLVEMLSDGPRMARDVISQATTRHISVEALRKARRLTHVRTRRKENGWEWYLTD